MIAAVDDGPAVLAVGAVGGALAVAVAVGLAVLAVFPGIKSSGSSDKSTQAIAGARKSSAFRGQLVAAQSRRRRAPNVSFSTVASWVPGAPIAAGLPGGGSCGTPGHGAFAPGGAGANGGEV